MALIDNAARSFALGYLMGLRVVDGRAITMKKENIKDQPANAEG